MGQLTCLLPAGDPYADLGVAPPDAQRFAVCTLVLSGMSPNAAPTRFSLGCKRANGSALQAPVRVALGDHLLGLQGKAAMPGTQYVHASAAGRCTLGAPAPHIRRSHCCELHTETHPCSKHLAASPSAMCT